MVFSKPKNSERRTDLMLVHKNKNNIKKRKNIDDVNKNIRLHFNKKKILRRSKQNFSTKHLGERRNKH